MSKNAPKILSMLVMLLYGIAVSWAQAWIEDGRVVVKSNAVAKPVALRYAWSNNPEAPCSIRRGFPQDRSVRTTGRELRSIDSPTIRQRETAGTVHNPE